MCIHTISSFLKKNKTFLLLGAIFMIYISIWWESVFAAEAATDQPVLSKENSEKIVKVLNGIITGAAAIMGLVTSFITVFLFPGWVNGTLFGLQDYLKEIWILVSNVVYFIFAFILIAIAFMNIIGKGEGTWELKQAMPKFIIGVLIVPFSWFFVQFLLSLSAILTVGMLTLPYDSFSDHDLFKKALDNTELAGEQICKDIIISFNGKFEWENSGAQPLTSQPNELDENIKCKDGGKISIKELITGQDSNGDYSSNAEGLQNSVFGVISIYAYGILRIQDLDTISGTQIKDISTIADLIFKIVFDLLFIVVYMLLMIALLLALFVRGVRLWLYMMLSPAFGLLYFFGVSSEWFGDTGEKFNIKEFIALALVPVYVSAALAFGLVFILVASEGIKETNTEPDTLKAGWFSLTLIGAHGWEDQEKSVIWKLIVELFGVVILWIAVMAALWASKTTKAIVEPIAKFGNDVWALAAKSPTYAPIIPTGNWQMQSAASLQKIWWTLTWNVENKASDRAKSFFSWEASQITGELQKINQSITSWAINAPKDQVEAAQKILKAVKWDVQKLYSNPESQKALFNLLQRVNPTDAKKIEKPENINSLEKVTEVFRYLEKDTSKYGGIIPGATWAGIQTSDIRDAVSAANEWKLGNTTEEVSNNFDFTINKQEISTASEAANAYIKNKNIFKNVDAVENDLRKNGINDSAVISEVVSAYKKAVDKDGDGIADSDWWDGE